MIDIEIVAHPLRDRQIRVLVRGGAEISGWPVSPKKTRIQDCAALLDP